MNKPSDDSRSLHAAWFVGATSDKSLPEPTLITNPCILNTVDPAVAYPAVAIVHGMAKRSTPPLQLTLPPRTSPQC
jgi:hypothetical protein